MIHRRFNPFQNKSFTCVYSRPNRSLGKLSFIGIKGSQDKIFHGLAIPWTTYSDFDPAKIRAPQMSDDG